MSRFLEKGRRCSRMRFTMAEAPYRTETGEAQADDIET